MPPPSCLAGLGSSFIASPERFNLIFKLFVFGVSITLLGIVASGLIGLATEIDGVELVFTISEDTIGAGTEASDEVELFLGVVDFIRRLPLPDGGLISSSISSNFTLFFKTRPERDIPDGVAIAVVLFLLIKTQRGENLER